MAKNKCTVYLGYEDEAITDKNKYGIDYKTNKIGGIPVSVVIRKIISIIKIYNFFSALFI